MTSVVISADASMTELFSGLPPHVFAKLIRQLQCEGADPSPKAIRGGWGSRTGFC